MIEKENEEKSSAKLNEVGVLENNRPIELPFWFAVRTLINKVLNSYFGVPKASRDTIQISLTAVNGI